MGIRVGLVHRTEYHYDRLVTLSPQIIRLRPAPHCRTTISSYSLRVAPSQHFINWQQDPHGNYLARFVFPEKTRSFKIEVELTAELVVVNPFDFFLEPEAMEFPFQYAPWLESELRPYLRVESAGCCFKKLVESIDRRQRRTVDFLVDLNRLIHNRVGYVIRMEPGVQSCEETLKKSSGSCRDSAWLLVQLLRALGLAARFVSGYLIQLKPDCKPLDGPAGAESDFTDLHAWTEVYLPGAGWIGLDPTSGLLAGEGHLPLAATPDPLSAAPITGAVDESKCEFNFHMSVSRLHEDPRVTFPYSDDEWNRIDALGERVDEALRSGDVRLTMGGEPTFVSIDDMDAPEWNTEALGVDKRARAGELFGRLADQFAHSPLLHYGQGKWYPGETLPRWALGCYWRKDGEPIWNSPHLTAADGADYGLTDADARKFIKALAEELNVDGSHVQPAYEDVWYYLWKERRLPINVDPLESKLDDAEERARLSRIFERGLEKIVGFALPIRPISNGTATCSWLSGPWFFRSERMYLIPGDSPMGYRLPLDSIPWVAPDDAQKFFPVDPWADRLPLPPYANDVSQERNGATAWSQKPAAVQPVPVVFQSTGGPRSETESVAPIAEVEDSWTTSTTPFPAPTARSADQTPWANVIRTSLCVECRQGILHVFLPPVERVEEFLSLVGAVERTARRLSIPVRFEGYTPPHDPRIDHFKITPDPGVIEVNLPPSASWAETVRMTTVLYEEARQSRLGTEKFMIDGRHTGTGGGNHVVLGGASPADSPFLRRPDLLKSLVTYWNNRPSLSYLFSGLFIGPTSQAPRTDEARHETIHELEIAMAQIPDRQNWPPWLTDRVFRHLLVDVTGNTHRTEFCIDKLYSPDSSTGRLGLVEFRAIEMPPHSRMSLVQQLLIRSLIASFWQSPCRQRLVRWGTALHDRFMLPHFVEQDFEEVLEDLTNAGFHFERDWFASHFEFRFPKYGEVVKRGIRLELRQAIEPWHVLGEESGGSGTVRFVDSSLERLQVKVQGMTDSRHVVVCNGERVPLHPTGVSGEFVAGVRYRAWQPPSCLHPTIGVHSPLVFEIIDSWNSQSIGGCTWHVAHPGGRNFDRFPVNSYEAESRRMSRFFVDGRWPGTVRIQPLQKNRDYPLTLDLRQFAEASQRDG